MEMSFRAAGGGIDPTALEQVKFICPSPGSTLALFNRFKFDLITISRETTGTNTYHNHPTHEIRALRKTSQIFLFKCQHFIKSPGIKLQVQLQSI